MWVPIRYRVLNGKGHSNVDALSAVEISMHLSIKLPDDVLLIITFIKTEYKPMYQTLTSLYNNVVSC